MKNLAILLVALMVILPCAQEIAAQTTTKHYLNAGADPQDKGRQPHADEEVVLSDSDVCDSGWGSGSGKKAGCYRATTAMIRRKSDHVLTAVYYCGNLPSDRHVVEGKLFTPVDLSIRDERYSSSNQQQVPPVVPPTQILQQFNLVIVGQPAPQYVPEQQIQPLWVDRQHSSHWALWLAGGLIAGGVLACVLDFCKGKSNTSSSNTGTVNTGGSAVVFSFGH